MKATAERLEGNRVALEIEVDVDRVEEALDRAYKKVVRQVSVPGFRKGRVPRKVLEMRFGKEVLYEEALEELVPEAYREALKMTETEAIDQPDVSNLEFEDGKPLRFRAEVDVKPDVELGEYKGVKVEKLVEQVESSDIDHVLEHLRDENAELVSVDRKDVREGDFAVIDFEGFVDGQPFQGGAGKGYTLEIGSGRFIEGFEEQLIGAEVGQETEVAVTFPDDYPSDELKGKDAVFKVTVQSIKARQLPKLDDEFAQDVSEAKTLLELRSQIREEMEESAKERADREMREKLLEAVRDASEVEVPEVLVERELGQMINEFARSLAMRGIDAQTYLQRTGRSVDDLKEEFRPDALNRVKTNLVLEAIAKREGIAVDEEELQAKIDELVEQAHDQESARTQLEDPDQQDALKESMVLEKTIEFLVEQADIEEKEIPSQGHGHHHHDHDDDESHDGDDDVDSGEGSADDAGKTGADDASKDDTDDAAEKTERTG